MSYIDQIERDGFAILENSIDNHTLELLEKEFQHVDAQSNVVEWWPCDHYYFTPLFPPSTQRTAACSTLNTLRSIYPPGSNGLRVHPSESVYPSICGPFSAIIRTIFDPAS